MQGKDAGFGSSMERHRVGLSMYCLPRIAFVLCLRIALTCSHTICMFFQKQCEYHFYFKYLYSALKLQHVLPGIKVVLGKQKKEKENTKKQA